jgi:hypothetical protein
MALMEWSRVFTGLIEMLVSGVKHHLDSATPAVRHLGMVVGEAVTSAVALEGQKLAFEVR